MKIIDVIDVVDIYPICGIALVNDTDYVYFQLISLKIDEIRYNVYEIPLNIYEQIKEIRDIELNERISGSIDTKKYLDIIESNSNDMKLLSGNIIIDNFDNWKKSVRMFFIPTEF